jgi:hypothetical protein
VLQQSGLASGMDHARGCTNLCTIMRVDVVHQEILAALAERANLAGCKARPRIRLGFHNRREVSKSHFAAVHESGIGTFRTCHCHLTTSASEGRPDISVTRPNFRK